MDSFITINANLWSTKSINFNHCANKTMYDRLCLNCWRWMCAASHWHWRIYTSTSIIHGFFCWLAIHVTNLPKLFVEKGCRFDMVCETHWLIPMTFLQDRRYVELSFIYLTLTFITVDEYVHSWTCFSLYQEKMTALSVLRVRYQVFPMQPGAFSLFVYCILFWCNIGIGHL